MASTSRLNRLTALVVDDSKIERIIHSQFLKVLGVDVIAVKNGKEAVDIHQSGKVFDLILMDLYMPVMNGLQATRLLREMGVSSIIVGVTGESKENEIQKFMEAGLNDCYEKPLTRENLDIIFQEINNS